MDIAVVIASSTIRVVTVASPLPCIAAGMPVGFKGVTRVSVAVEALMHQNRDAWPITLRCLVD